jgi:hypothetical protein
MRWWNAYHRRKQERRAEKRLEREAGVLKRHEAVQAYEPMVRGVLEQFKHTDFPDSEFLKTGPEEWELRHLSGTGEIQTDLKIELHFGENRPHSFVCVYYRFNGMHMRQAPLRREALVQAVRKCISS